MQSQLSMEAVPFPEPLYYKKNPCMSVSDERFAPGHKSKSQSNYALLRKDLIRF